MSPPSSCFGLKALGLGLGLGLVCWSRLLGELWTRECRWPETLLPMWALVGRKNLRSEEEEGTFLLVHAWLVAHFPMLALLLHNLTWEQFERSFGVRGGGSPSPRVRICSSLLLGSGLV